MSNQIQRLKLELERTLEMLGHFQEFAGALNYTALALLVESKSKDDVIRVAVRDVSGHFYRGKIEGIPPGGGSFMVLADDGELVRGVTAERIVSVRFNAG